MTPRVLLIALGILLVVATSVGLWAMGFGRLEVDIDIVPAPAIRVGPHGLEDVVAGVFATFFMLLVIVGGPAILAWWAWRALAARRSRSGPWS